MSNPTPTEEGEAIIEGFRNGENACVEARAGCGKTTMIKMTANALKKKDITYVVFNVKNADDLKKDESKPANITASTFGSLGLKSLGRNVNVKVKQLKDGKWTKGKIEELLLKERVFNPFSNGLSRDDKSNFKDNYDAATECIKLLKNTYISPSWTDVLNLIDRYQISACMERAEFAHFMVDFLKKSDEDQYNVDYEDMIRFCVLNGKAKNITQDIFMVDEHQDSTIMRIEFIKQIAENSQIGVVGDDRQAIYFFAGSSSEGLKITREKIPDMVLYPLTVNFRCDKNIIREAQRLVPDIKWHESKEDGVVSYIDMDILDKHIKPGDVGISRYNKVIIPQCFRFIRKGIPATIQGADFGKILKSQVAGFRCSSIPDFYAKLGNWYDKQCQYSDNNPSEAVEERFGCLKFLADQCDTVEQIAGTIDNIFKDTTSKSTITFSTGHRSKGLEWDNVFILDSNNFISRRPDLPTEQALQEKNIFYVAQTRARHNLTYCSTQKKEDE